MVSSDGIVLYRCGDVPELRRLFGRVDTPLRIIHGLAVVADIDGDKLR